MNYDKSATAAANDRRLYDGIEGLCDEPAAAGLMAETGSALLTVSELCARLMSIADRLCGPALSGASSGKSVDKPMGEAAELRRMLRTTSETVYISHEALSRIERELF